MDVFKTTKVKHKSALPLLPAKEYLSLGEKDVSTHAAVAVAVGDGCNLDALNLLHHDENQRKIHGSSRCQ